MDGIVNSYKFNAFLLTRYLPPGVFATNRSTAARVYTRLFRENYQNFKKERFLNKDI